MRSAASFMPQPRRAASPPPPRRPMRAGALDGVLELNSLLATAVAASKSHVDVFERMKAHASVESVKKEFLKLLEQHHAKIAEMSAAAEFNVKFGKIHAALDKWSFEDCPWLLKQKDVEGAAAVKKIEGIATSLHTYRVVFETIANDIWWASL